MRIGLLGGSFDPPHIAHVAMARTALSWGLDEIWWIPAAVPPHKQDSTLAEGLHRLVMTELATLDDPAMRVLPLEIERGAISYTIDTLETLRREHPEAEFYLLVGQDNWHTIGKWHRIDDFPQYARFMVFGRENPEPEPDIPASVQEGRVLFPEFGMELSSTAIRADIAANRGGWQHQVPDLVAQYIIKHGLYGAPQPAVPAAPEDSLL